MPGDARPLIEQWADEYACDPDYLAEVMALDFAEKVVEAMAAQGLTRRALARKMSVSPAYISRTLNAPANLTLRTIAAFGVALGLQPGIVVRSGLRAVDSGPATPTSRALSG